MVSTLVVNPGSSSRKFALYVDGRVVLEMRYEETDTGFEMCSMSSGTNQVCESVTKKDFEASFARVAEEVRSYLAHQFGSQPLGQIAVRVVAPGTFFQKHRVIDNKYIETLQKREKSAPLHIPILLREIKAIHQHFPGLRIIGASDSAFHANMPKQAREYSLPRILTEEYDIYRFGYHGLSVSSIVRRIHSVVGFMPSRMVVCHVGSGTSVTAVKDGVSVETTMGFAPSTGVVMSTRGGDVDNAALLEVMKIKNLSPADVETLLNTTAGLQGLAGDSDIRILLNRRSKGDIVATQALETFSYHIQKAIASQTVALGGLDVLVLTATASVRSADLRTLIVRGLSHLGVKIGDERNQLMVGKEGVISVRNSPVKVVVMRTDEMGEMATAVTIVDQEIYKNSK
jgi:acetate kinase